MQDLVLLHQSRAHMTGDTHPTDALFKETMKDVISAEDGVSSNPTQPILKQAFTTGDHCRILLGLALTFDGIVCQGLLGRDRRDDENGIQS